MRYAKIERKTAETDIVLELNIDGVGVAEVDSGCGFFDHMMTLLARHGGFDIKISCKGDTQVDYHHTIEDIGICLGDALRSCMGDKRGIKRYGYFILPMDESLILTSLDLCDRAYLGYDVEYYSQKVGELDVELIKEFFLALTRRASFTLHIKKLSGENTHHIIEGIFKCVARSLRAALETDGRFSDTIPSTKGAL